MRRDLTLATALFASLALPALTLAQLTTAGIRGKVVDEAGRPLADVTLDFVYKGESRVPITKTQRSDKKGGFVRMGLNDGKWQITFAKEGYKTYVMEISLSLGGFSEAGEVVLTQAAAAAPAAAPGEPVAAVLPPSEEATSAGAEYAKALEAARAGRFDEAEPALKEVLAKFPDLADAHYNLGYVHQMKKDWKSAEAEFQRVTELQPASRDAYIALAQVREMDGRGPAAAEGLLAAAPGFTEDAKFQYALGIVTSNVGRSADAEAAFRRAAELDPTSPEPLFQLATICIGQNKVAEAVGLLEKYLGMTGQNPANVETAKGLLGALKKKP
jgi:Flp pilus assembly protein TadD